MKTVAHLGKKGSYSYLAGRKQVGQGKYLSCASFQQVFEMVYRDEADCGVLPIENSLVGSIYENYDWLNQYNLKMIAEEYVRIEHCLLTIKAIDYEEDFLKGIRQVWSHPKAIEQCSLFFRNYPWIEPVLTGDTAQAAYEIASRGDSSLAALASREAAEIYGLSLCKQGLEDDPANYTRFVMVAKKDKNVAGKNKAALFLILDHRPGSLASVLSQIAQQNINLTKIESRPFQGHPFEYLFYVDLEFQDENPENIAHLLETIYPLVKQVKLLGYYAAGSKGT